VPKAPDEDLESPFVRGDLWLLLVLLVVIAIEHHQTAQPGIGPASLAKVFERARGASTTEDHGIAFDATSQAGFGTTRPTFEDLAIPGSLYIENEGVT